MMTVLSKGHELHGVTRAGSSMKKAGSQHSPDGLNACQGFMAAGMQCVTVSLLDAAASLHVTIKILGRVRRRCQLSGKCVDARLDGCINSHAGARRHSRRLAAGIALLIRHGDRPVLCGPAIRRVLVPPRQLRLSRR